MGAARFNHHLISQSISNRPPNDDANILTSKCRKPLLPRDSLPGKTVTLGSSLWLPPHYTFRLDLRESSHPFFVNKGGEKNIRHLPLFTELSVLQVVVSKTVRMMSKIYEDLNPFTENPPKNSRFTPSASSFPERNKVSK